jgi:hypothetical protein
LKTGHLFSFSTRATERFATNDFHGNPITSRCSFPQALRQPSAVRLSVVCCRIRGTGDAADELDDFDNVKDAGGGTTAERWMNGLQNLAVEPQTDADDPPSTPWISGRVGRLQTMENFDNLSSDFSFNNGGVLLFTFATVLAKSGMDLPLTTPLSATAALLSLH